MKPAIAVVLGMLAVTLPVNGQSPQAISEESISRAIRCGMGELKCDRMYLSGGGMNMLGWNVQVIPPLGRIYLAASDAKTKYMKFTRADVTTTMLEPVLTIRARNENNDMKFNPQVKHIVLLPKGKKEGAIQPTSIEDWNYDAKNLMGASVTRVGKSAVFSLGEIPAGDFDVVVINEGSYKDHRVSIDGKDRANLSAWAH